MDNDPTMDDDDRGVADLLDRSAHRPTDPPDIETIHSRARRRRHARSILAASAAIVALAGIAGILASTGDDPESVTAADNTSATTETTIEPTTTTEPVTTTEAPTTTAPVTTTEAPTTTETTTTETTTTTEPTNPSDGEVVADLPRTQATGERPDVGHVYDLVLHADSQSRCAWATDASTGQVYSMAWYEGSTVRFVWEDGEEQPAEFRDPDGRVIARAGDRFDELVTNPPRDAQLTHCDVNGDGPDIGPIDWDHVP